MDPAIQKKLSAAFDKLASTDIKEPRYNRTVDKSLRRMGFKKRPPQYQSYWSNAIFEGVFFHSSANSACVSDLLDNGETTYVQYSCRCLCWRFLRAGGRVYISTRKTSV